MRLTARKPLTTRQEVIKVAGGEDVTITVRSTPNGPIMSDVLESTAAAGDSAPVPAPGQAPDSAKTPPKGSGYAVALKWTALTPRPTFDAFDMMNTAEWDDFRKAAEFVSVPAQNLLYADTSGRIGYQARGHSDPEELRREMAGSRLVFGVRLDRTDPI